MFNETPTTDNNSAKEEGDEKNSKHQSAAETNVIDVVGDNTCNPPPSPVGAEEAKKNSNNDEVLGSVTGTNNNRVGAHGQQRNHHHHYNRMSPGRLSAVLAGGAKITTDDIQLYRHKFHLVQPSTTTTTTTTEQITTPSEQQPASVISNNQLQLAPVTIVEAPMSANTSAITTPVEPQQQQQQQTGASFNKYPAPVFVKTVKSARASLIKRGLAEGAARRTKVNNDLRDELTRIIQFTAEQRNYQLRQQQQLQQQQQQQMAKGRQTPPLSPSSRASRLMQSRQGATSVLDKEQEEELIKKGYTPEIYSAASVRIGPDGHPEYPSEIWPSSRMSSTRYRSSSQQQRSSEVSTPSLPSAVAPRRNANYGSDGTLITPPNSAVATAGSDNSGELLMNNTSQNQQRRSNFLKTRSVTPGLGRQQQVRGAVAPRSAAPQQKQQQQAEIGDNNGGLLLPPVQRRFIACVVSQNFALKLLQQGGSQEGRQQNGSGQHRSRKKDHQNNEHYNPINDTNNNYFFTNAFGIRRLRQRSYSRSFETIHQ